MWSKIKEYPLHAGVIGSPAFTGTGTDDLSMTGNPGFSASRSYRVRVDSTSETFEWSNDGGGTWEETDVPIIAGRIYALVNAEGEKEGVNVIFASASGHVNGDLWNITTTGTVVSNTAVAVGAMQVNSGSGEKMILRGEYDKGAEDGLLLYVVQPRTSVSTVLNRPGRNLDLGDGGLHYKEEYFKMTADANYMYKVDLVGIGYYRVYQIRQGTTSATGLFTCFAEIYKTL